MSFKNVFFLLLLVLCLSAEAASRYWPLQLGDEYFTKLELAITPEAKIQGLMHRTSLAEDGGMLFLSEKPEILVFWMRNTRIPLDILFIAEDGTITDIFTMQVPPPQPATMSEKQYLAGLSRYSSSRPVIAAIELNAGTAAAIGLHVGQKVDLHRQELKKSLSKQPGSIK